jgi:hypothetical protein
VEDARFLQPIDGYRRNLCEGRLDLLVAPAAEASCLLSVSTGEGYARLITWSGEFVQGDLRRSARYLAGEVSTNANVLVPDWEVSVCIGLLMGGLGLGSITVPEPPPEDVHAFERIASALRIVGVQMRTAAAAPATGKVASFGTAEPHRKERNARRARRIAARV